jgi:hypothetical protein
MLWICRECGLEISADDDLVAAWIGWAGLDGDTGICPPCGGSAARTSIGVRTRDTLLRQHRSHRALAMTRIMIDRARGKLWDETALEAAADRLGYSPTVCGACDAARKRDCPTCEGSGMLWRRGETLLTGSGLLRLAMWPERKS